MRWILLPSVLLFACSDPSLSSGQAGTPEQVAPDKPQQPGGPGTPPVPDAPTCAEGFGISQVSGLVNDDLGRAAAGGEVQLCLDVVGAPSSTCLRPVSIDPTGAFLVSVPTESQCVLGGVIRAIPARATTATTYCQLPLRSPDGRVAIARPLVVWRTAPATALPEGGGTVEFGEAVSMDVDAGRIDPADYASLGVRAVDPASVCDPLLFDGLFAFAPEMDIPDAGFDLYIDTAFDPGSTVALFVKGGLECSLADGSRPDLGQWHDYGTVLIDEHRQLRITGDNALPCLGWLGWYALDVPDDRLPPPGEDPEPPPPDDQPGEPPMDPPMDPPRDPPVDPGVRPGPPNPAVAPEAREIAGPADLGVPIIEVLGPLDGQVHLAGQPIEISARITDGEGLSATELVWAFNGERYGCPINEQDITCSVEGDLRTWNITAGSPAPRPFSIRARNTRNRVTRTPERVADVRNSLDARPPRVNVIDPTPDTVWRSNSTVDLVARISDDGAVADVQLQWEYNGNDYPCPHRSQYVDCDVNGDSYAWRIQVGTGVRAFQIRATDDEGNATLSRRISLDLE